MTWAALLNLEHEPDRQGRSHFVRDYDKIVFSQSFRLLQNKTQVLPFPADDFVHSRLTHSLEVSSVGRSLGQIVGQRLAQEEGLAEGGRLAVQLAEVVRAACLAHDIGNPPFGHGGEKAIREFFSHLFVSFQPWPADDPRYHDFTNFEGNAQGFRFINGEGDFVAGKLSPLTRLAFSKYTRSAAAPDYLRADACQRCDQAKAGFYSSEQPLFAELARASGLSALSADGRAFVRHPLAWLVEAADDICYRVLDLEDGMNLNYIGYDEGSSLLCELAGVARNSGVPLLRSKAIQRLIEAVVDAFWQHSSCMLAGELRASLFELLPPAVGDILVALQELSRRRLYRHPQVLESLIAGCRVLRRILAIFVGALCTERQGPEAEQIRHLMACLVGMNAQEWADFDQQADDYQRLRYVTDFVANLSDRSILSLMRKLEGSSLG